MVAPDDFMGFTKDLLLFRGTNTRKCDCRLNILNVSLSVTFEDHDLIISLDHSDSHRPTGYQLSPYLKRGMKLYEKFYTR